MKLCEYKLSSLAYCLSMSTCFRQSMKWSVFILLQVHRTFATCSLLIHRKDRKEHFFISVFSFFFVFSFRALTVVRCYAVLHVVAMCIKDCCVLWVNGSKLRRSCHCLPRLLLFSRLLLTITVTE